MFKLKNLKNKLKFWLGFTCVAQHYNGKYVITKKKLGLVRVCRDKGENYWWCHEDYWEKYCLFDTKEKAEYALANNVYFK